MKNHILECDKIPASQKAVYERHPVRHCKRQSSAPVDPAKRRKFDGLLKVNALSHLDGVENKAVVQHGVGDMRIDRVPIPAIPSGHVLVSMRSVSICGSDFHYWWGGRIGDFVLQKSVVLGHERSGFVRLVGAEVEGFEEGDLSSQASHAHRVAIARVFVTIYAPQLSLRLPLLSLAASPTLPCILPAFLLSFRRRYHLTKQVCLNLFRLEYMVKRKPRLVRFPVRFEVNTTV